MGWGGRLALSGNPNFTFTVQATSQGKLLSPVHTHVKWSR